MSTDTANRNTFPESLFYAGFWLRFFAALIDWFIIGFVEVVIILPILNFMGYTIYPPDLPAEDIAKFAETAIAANIGSTVVGWLYYGIMQSSKKQATLGKVALGIKVTNLYGARINFGQATGRYFAKFLSALILFIGYFMVAFTPKKQGLHDMLAGTLVVRKEYAEEAKER